MRRRRRRELDDQERLLWDAVTRSVTPLPIRASELARRMETPALPTTVMPAAGSENGQAEFGLTEKTEARSAAPARGKTALPAMVAMVRKERRAIVRGLVQIDGKLDLHGYRQDQAASALRAFLKRSSALGCRTVLIVTGKGAAGRNEAELPWAAEGGRGVLRRLLPMLLEAPELREIVLGYELADQRHGGAGALYVRLRRKLA